MKVAAIGDIHGCIEELTELLARLEWLSLDGIYSLGDICDRGPDSGTCYALLREKRIPTILGNHDAVLLEIYDAKKKGNMAIRSKDKERSISQMCDADFEFIRQMPRVHVVDEAKVILVHGGLWPKLPLYAQPSNVVRTNLIHLDKPNQTRWWGEDAPLHQCKKTEAESRAEGWVRWYEAYDYDYACVYGHSGFVEPFVYRPEGFGPTIGIDTGCVFGGSLTSAIIEDGDWKFVSVKAKKNWFGGYPMMEV